MNNESLNASSTPAERFANAVADALSNTASSHSGSRWEGRVSYASSDANSSRSSRPLTVLIEVGGTLSGEVFLSVYEELIGPVLVDSGGNQPENISEAWLAWANSSKDHVARSLQPVFGSVTVDRCEPVSRPDGLKSFGSVRLLRADGMEGSIDVLAGPELWASLEGVLAGSASVTSGGGLDLLENRRPLQRVIDVPLPVTLRFGQRQLTLRELLALNTGSLVELDRQVEEPVDLMLGDRVVARGEVVIVDGNYGMRVTEVVERTPNRSNLGTPIGPMPEQNRAVAPGGM